MLCTAWSTVKTYSRRRLIGKWATSVYRLKFLVHEQKKKSFWSSFLKSCRSNLCIILMIFGMTKQMVTSALSCKRRHKLEYSPTTRATEASGSRSQEMGKCSRLSWLEGTTTGSTSLRRTKLTPSTQSTSWSSSYLKGKNAGNGPSIPSSCSDQAT